MSAFKSLALAIELATAKRDQALAQLQAMWRAHAFAQEQMDQLRQYAVETDQRWTQGAQKSTTPELLHHHYQFTGRLEQAIALQDGALGNAMQRVEAAKQALLQTELRLASLKQVLTHRQASVAKVQHKRDQKQMDEFAALQTQRQLRQQAENQT
jgi:flagellar FliJ protein